jgi:glycosyltransferase involved in cell wall biosynthesis
MKILFAHRLFASQFSRMCTFLPKMGDYEIYFMSMETPDQMEGVQQRFYEKPRSVTPEIHPYVAPFEAAALMGQAAAKTAQQLKQSGWTPDLIVGHTAWGETMFLKTVYPHVPLLAYPEFFHKIEGGDYGFDPEFPLPPEDAERVIARNATNLVSWLTADWGLVPTEWQRSLFPAEMQSRMSVIHEGVLTDEIKPNPEQRMTLKSGHTYTTQDQVITFAARNLEPYRGFHTMMRAVPEILRRHPEAVIAFVGGDEVSYGVKHVSGKSWRQVMREEITALDPALDIKRVWFTGNIPYEPYLALLQLSSTHVYLTYPFILSWSMLEAMSAGCAVIGSRTGPVEEVIRHGENGLLVDFFDAEGVADAVTAVLTHPDRMAGMRQAARQTVIDGYDVKTKILPKVVTLFEDLVAGRRPETS